MLVIDPEECIDCGACEPECPVEAIFPEDALPEKWEPFVQDQLRLRPGPRRRQPARRRVRRPSTTSELTCVAASPGAAFAYRAVSACRSCRRSGADHRGAVRGRPSTTDELRGRRPAISAPTAGGSPSRSTQLVPVGRPGEERGTRGRSAAVVVIDGRQPGYRRAVWAGSVTRMSVPPFDGADLERAVQLADALLDRPRATAAAARARRRRRPRPRGRRRSVAATVISTRLGGPRRTAWSTQLADDRVERDARGRPDRRRAARGRRRRRCRGSSPPGRQRPAAPDRSRDRAARPARARRTGRAARGS